LTAGFGGDDSAEARFSGFQSHGFSQDGQLAKARGSKQAGSPYMDSHCRTLPSRKTAGLETLRASRMNAATHADLILTFWTSLAAALSLAASGVSLSEPEFMTETLRMQS